MVVKEREVYIGWKEYHTSPSETPENYLPVHSSCKHSVNKYRAC